MAFTISVIKPYTLKAQVDVNDSLALVALYNSTDGPHWSNHTNWLTSKPVSYWYGLKIKQNRVTEIRLQQNLLSGYIPHEIGNLTSVTYCYLFHNQLKGNLPAELGNLAQMISLDISYNQLSGNIPPELGSLNLGYLYLENINWLVIFLLH